MLIIALERVIACRMTIYAAWIHYYPCGFSEKRARAHLGILDAGKRSGRSQLIGILRYRCVTSEGHKQCATRPHERNPRRADSEVAPIQPIHMIGGPSSYSFAYFAVQLTAGHHSTRQHGLRSLLVRRTILRHVDLVSPRPFKFGLRSTVPNDQRPSPVSYANSEQQQRRGAMHRRNGAGASAVPRGYPPSPQKQQPYRGTCDLAFGE